VGSQSAPIGIPPSKFRLSQLKRWRSLRSVLRICVSELISSALVQQVPAIQVRIHFPPRSGAKVLGVMMTGGAFGSLVGGWVYGLIGPVWLALSLLHRHRAGDPCSPSSAAVWRNPSISSRSESGAGRRRRAERRPAKKSTNSYVLCRCNCSTSVRRRRATLLQMVAPAGNRFLPRNSFSPIAPREQRNRAPPFL
jgi:hypothetical protein